jgi:hypothetical protein
VLPFSGKKPKMVNEAWDCDKSSSSRRKKAFGYFSPQTAGGSFVDRKTLPG